MKTLFLAKFCLLSALNGKIASNCSTSQTNYSTPAECQKMVDDMDASPAFVHLYKNEVSTQDGATVLEVKPTCSVPSQDFLDAHKPNYVKTAGAIIVLFFLGAFVVAMWKTGLRQTR